jgi:hypothetical protein
MAKAATPSADKRRMEIVRRIIRAHPFADPPEGGDVRFEAESYRALFVCVKRVM